MNSPLSNKKFALIDCNNFYVSCERVFNPKLQNKPVAVLSNNDGVIVSRSNEVKKLGIPMGAPVFKWREKLEENNVQLFSSNYALYGDMSNRVMMTLLSFKQDIEIYSIDEAFMDVSNIAIEQLRDLGLQIKSRVYKWTGIPVSVGFGSTKTLAKAANEYAKKHFETGGVVNFIGEKDVDKYLSQIEVSDVWGVGYRNTPKLKNQNFKTAERLKYANRKLIKKKYGVTLERTILELNDISCIRLSNGFVSKKTIASTRSFGRYVTDYSELSEAISSYVATASEKLRKQRSLTETILIFIRTNFRNKDPRKYANSIILKLPSSTSHTPTITKYALVGLKKIFKAGYKYQKAGVVLLGIRSETDLQLNIEEKDQLNKISRQNNQMEVIDRINQKYGRFMIKTAAEGIEKSWKMKNEIKSKRYTTSFLELLEVK